MNRPTSVKAKETLMKRKVIRLKLNRETVRKLDTANLSRVAAGYLLTTPEDGCPISGPCHPCISSRPAGLADIGEIG